MFGITTKTGTSTRYYMKYDHKNELIHHMLIADLSKKLHSLQEQCREAVGDMNIVPADYPQPFKKRWDMLYSQKDWNSSYPCNKDGLLEFERFCEESGGFIIS